MPSCKAKADPVQCKKQKMQEERGKGKEERGTKSKGVRDNARCKGVLMKSVKRKEKNTAWGRKKNKTKD